MSDYFSNLSEENATIIYHYFKKNRGIMIGYVQIQM